MGGPSDSGTADAPSDDFQLTPLDFGASPTLSKRFRLKMEWNTPHLEWKPIKGLDPSQPGLSPPPPADPDEAFEKFGRYLRGGGYLFDLHNADWAPVDRAFQHAPTDPPSYIPTLAQILAWQDAGFFGRVGRTSSPGLFDASLSMAPQAPPSLYLKPPPPPPIYGEQPLARPGEAGDVLEAWWNLPITQRAYKSLSNQAERHWDSWTGWKAAAKYTASGVFLAGAVGALAASDDLRHFAGEHLLGVNIPVYLLNHHFSLFRVPGTSVRFDGYGAASDYLRGANPDPSKPRPFQFMLMLDVPEAIDAITKRK